MLGPINFWAPAPLRRLHAKIGLSEAEPERVAVGDGASRP
jgi:RND superfamily putative drug exporter